MVWKTTLHLPTGIDASHTMVNTLIIRHLPIGGTTFRAVPSPKEIDWAFPENQTISAIPKQKPNSTALKLAKSMLR